MTALSLAVISVAFVVMDILLRKKGTSAGKRLIWIPAALNILGLVISMIAPGNSVRGEALSSMNPVVAVLRSVYHVFDVCINEWLRWEVIVLLGCVAIVSFGATGYVRIKLKYPVLFSAFCFLMAAVNFVPPLYAIGSFEAGRMQSIIWMQFVVLMVLIVVYDSIWLGQRLRDKKNTEVSVKGLAALCVLLVVGMALSLYVDRNYITSASALSDLLNGNAAVYAAENKDRLKLLRDPECLEAVLSEHTVKPSLLYFSDVTEDSQDWVNKAVADYYEKSSVILVR
jgi:hypothetical protein